MTERLPVTGPRLHCLTLLGALLLGGCASAVHWTPAPPAAQRLTPPDERRDVGAEAVQAAAAQVGAPYRYGGASPRGFDCSGLVFFAYRRAGLRVPRTTRDLYRRARPIAVQALQPGDLLFFDFESKVGHVAIYAGDNQFIHAPSSGKQVTRGSLDDRFWRARLVGVGRLVL